MVTKDVYHIRLKNRKNSTGEQEFFSVENSNKKSGRCLTASWVVCSTDIKLFNIGKLANRE